MSNDWIVQVVQGGIAIAVLVWVVQIGLKRLSEQDKQAAAQYEAHKLSTEKLINYLLEENKRLGDTLITCISAINAGESPCADK